MAEGDQGDRWSVRPDHESLHDISLEDEIHMLRRKMEQIFMEEKSFTSEIVIEISSLLDLKINEYMKANPIKGR
ncbi:MULTISPECIES: aspartyl-phosphate phosphatase Spo0E family protein [Paenibacillus]|uniref:aspartyl-phosphate phosphatase Spo0E family protein n=1 Tax=Paenibacillus TaxID=44249 RepID=UPI0027D9315F|nr:MULTISPECIES: aspartyl-phosphate phosphatase Spo0E family protein [Paenibacillus]